jgi:hypothetical protein
MFNRIGLCIGLKIFFAQANWIPGLGGLNLFNTQRQSSHPVGIPFHAFLAIYVMFQDKFFEVNKWICFELFL